jgi:hypothetical protein
MEFENLKSSNNKYDRIFFETIEDVFNRMDIEIDKGEFYKTYLNKKQKKHQRQYKEIEGFSGPFRGKYLKGYAPQFRGKYFDTIKEALEHFKNDDYAEGITLARNGKYTLRRSNILLDSQTNGNGSIEISWVLNDRTKLDINDGGIYIKIKIKGYEYFFNTNNYKIYDSKNKYYGKMVKGTIIKHLN